MAQTLSPVFTDNFRNGSTTGTTSIPGGSPTASSTSYNFASTKNATASAITSGTLRLTFAATTSGFAEAQAVFSSTPVRLTSLGDAINFRYAFIDTANVLTGSTSVQGEKVQLANASALAVSKMVPLAGGTVAVPEPSAFAVLAAAAVVSRLRVCRRSAG